MSSLTTSPHATAETGASPGLAVTMPQMGVSVAEGTVVAWHVGVGDQVVADQPICDVSTDKIDTEVPSPGAGVVTEILVAVDETVPVGAVLARLNGADRAPVAAAAEEPAEQPSSGAPAGNQASEAPGGGGAIDSHGPTWGPEDPGHLGPTSHPSDRYYSPVVRRVAADRGVDLEQITGTGRGGRVRKQDVLAAAEQPTVDPPMHIESPYRPDPPMHIKSPYRPDPPMHIESPYRPEPEPESPPAVAAVPQTATPTTLSRMRRQIGEHMKRSLATAATCTTWAEADMTSVEAARSATGMTALPYVARACVLALGRHPALNATLEGERYARYDRVNLGIAVSLGDEGLIVPVIHDAQDLSLEGLARRIKELARAARGGTLTPDDTRGGTFTITNPGQYGSIMATPVINQPQVAILDLEAVVKRPVVVSVEGTDAVAIRAMTILGLSWDHRCLDGVASAQFLAEVRRELESVS